MNLAKIQYIPMEAGVMAGVNEFKSSASIKGIMCLKERTGFE